MGKNWFTVERIAADTFAISEEKHWEETHCYLLCGRERALLIDTGLGVADIRTVAEGLTFLPITVAATHAHWDHIGGHKYFAEFAVHETEKEWLSGSFPLPLEAVKKNLLRGRCSFPKEFDIDRYEIFQGEPKRLLHDGDSFELGNRLVEIVHTPGHSPGHCCFYEEERRYLYAGDLVYRGCLDAFYPTTDPREFLRSLKKLEKLEIDKLLPAHHGLPVPPDIIGRAASAFEKLEREEKLYHGSGIFDFGDFQLRI